MYTYKRRQGFANGMGHTSDSILHLFISPSPSKDPKALYIYIHLRAEGVFFYFFK